ncbi:hypothetical protein BKA70DRAFT_1246118 [Coprinopsis sp. MPI-PUGE-AT-0042]|nr:hypothetical protein BKA70DRAFT_1246118 [Coprinopsis sp. MPI-PUGE-AT-0042]
MSVEELTRLALSPFNFSRLVATKSEDPLPEIQIRTFKLRMRRFEEISPLRSLHLLPGGRYLFTYHSDDICLWDLGYGRFLPSPFPIACLHIEGICGAYGKEPPCPTDDGNGVRLIDLLNHGRNTRWALEMYDICPALEQPVFQRVISWKVPPDSCIVGHSSQYAVVHNHGTVEVYAVSDADTKGPRCTLQTSYLAIPQAAILGGIVLLWTEYDQASVNVFNIPPTSSETSQCSPIIVVPCLTPADIRGIVYTSEWTAHSTRDAFFALVGDTPNDMELYLYRLVNLGAILEPLLPLAMPVKICQVTLAGWCDFIGGPSLRRLSSDLAVIGIAGGELTVAKMTHLVRHMKGSAPFFQGIGRRRLVRST